MALGEASVEIVPDLSKFINELERGVRSGMAEAAATADKAGEQIEQAFNETAVQVGQALEKIADRADGAFKDAAGRWRDSTGKVMSQSERMAAGVVNDFEKIGSQAAQSGEKIERSFREAASQSEAKLKGIGSGFGKILGGIGVALAGVGLTQWISGGLGEAEAAQKAIANTAQLIESTGGKAGVTQKQIESLSNSMRLEIGIDDTAVLEASNALLTFTGVTGPIFDETIMRAADLSAVFDTDLQGATMQLGKALNDPVKGLTALSRSGVQFTAEQKEQIKTMVAAGDTAGAQRLILDELATQFGGTAAASASATDKIKASFGELSESVGVGLLGALEAVGPSLAAVFEKLQKPLTKVGKELGKALSSVLEAVGPVLPVIADALGKVLTNFGKIVEALAPAIKPLANILATVAEVVSKVLAKAFQAMAPVITAFVDAISVIIDTIGPVILDIFKQLAPVITQVAQAFSKHLAAVLPIIVSLIEQLAPVFVDIASVIGELASILISTLMPPLSELVTTVLAALAPVLPQIAEAFLQIVEALLPLIPPLLEIVVALLPPLTDLLVAVIPLIGTLAEMFAAGLAASIRLVTPIIEKVAAAITVVVEWIGKLITWVANVITSFTNWLKNWRETLTMIKQAVVDAFPQIIQWFRDLPGRILSAIGNLGQTLWTKAQELMRGLREGVTTAWDTVRNWFSDLPNKVKNAVGNVDDTLVEKGRNILNGLKNGITSAWEDVQSWLSGTAGRVKALLLNAGNWLLDIGKSVINGLWQGMQAAWKNVAGWLGGLGGAIVNLKGPPAKDAVMLYRNGQLIMQGLQSGMESGFKGVRTFLAGASKEISSFGDRIKLKIPMPGLGGVGMPSELSTEEIDKVFADLDLAEKELTLGNRTLKSYERLLLDSIGKFEVYSDEYMRIYSLLSSTQDDLVRREEDRAAAELERIKNRYEATSKGGAEYLALLRAEQTQYRKWSSEWMAIQSEINGMRDITIEKAYEEAEAAREVADATNAQTEARREYLTVIDPKSEASEDEKKRAGMAYAQSIYERLQAKAAAKNIPDRSVRWARYMRKRLIDVREGLDGINFKYVRQGIDQILVGIPDLEKVEKDDSDPTSGDESSSSPLPRPSTPVPPPQSVTPRPPGLPGPILRPRSVGVSSVESSPTVSIGTANFYDGTDAELVAQKVNAGLAIRSMS